MLLLILLFYVLPVYLVFFHFKWIPLTPLWKFILPLPPLFAMVFVWFAIGRYAPIVSDAYVQAPVVQLAPQVAGVVSQVLVDDNSLVNKGTPLFQIDPAPFQYRTDQARAKMFEAKEQTISSIATLYAATESLNREETSLAAAGTSVESAQADLALSQASIDRVQAQVKRADADVERAAKLIEGKAISQEEYDERLQSQAVYRAELEEAKQREIKARAGVNVATIQVLAAEAAIRAARAQRSKAMSTIAPVDTLQNALDRLESDLASIQKVEADGGASSPRVKELETEIVRFKKYLVEAQLLAPELQGRLAPVIQAESALNQAEYDEAQTTVIAPVDGIVTNLHLTAGTYVGPGKPMMTLIDTSSWRLVAPVPENWLSRIKVGDDVQIALRNYPMGFRQGKVLHVGRGALSGQGVPGGTLPDSQSRMGRQLDTPEMAQDFQVIVTLADDQPDQPLRVGATGRAVIFADGGLIGINQVATLILTITSFMDQFFPKPPLFTLLVAVTLILAMVALLQFIRTSHKAVGEAQAPQTKR
ncbi:MAG: HlyD family efflux transporter periplasmic adaptor subunit [Pirellula sp.]|jgi:multidrug resistance efflux pump|nr:HlyD family efflux transporter periplasmic adaptor subunit [Pirellula sp.]